ncbi:esterase FE4 isoform X2 [Tribolium castaneum]|uniref:esterase FE4 isoform X2 n=1 Tax=Tribolium castaneum TaxID=7070 RepID=UPI00077DBCC4|nr:PREDICTED: esterase FE4-like isoform X2 [Tribolium castaneum]|eukprot:XP_015837950.1 PREDICTED: esterase FE4-like isoform X2 [Tribolium castaneum]
MIDNEMFAKTAIIFILMKFVCSDNGNSIIQLPNGKILGREAVTFDKKSYYAFEKIPYATPPLGSLRFKAPQSAQNWDGILNTTHMDVTCMQVTKNLSKESEDCLYLNVYTPQLPHNDNVSFPVMLYIHGGAFMHESSMDSAPDLFLNNDIIFVSINYRLGPFGFLSTQDEVIPGNNGLKDQLLAIRWTHDNIIYFGGDPGRIIISGESAGSASVAYQLLNPHSQDLFQGAILESGSCLSPWSYQRNSRNIAFATAAILNSTFETNNDSQALLEFLQNVDAQELDAAAQKYLNKVSTPWDYDVSQGCVWAPVIEPKNPDAFLTKKMYGLVKAGNIAKVPILMGFNSEESLYFNKDPDTFKSSMETWDKNLDIIVPNDMQITDQEQRVKVGQAIREIYTGGQPFADNLGAGIRYSSDTSFTRPIRKHAEFASSFTQIFFYQFSYDGILGNINVHYDGAENVGHTEIIKYLFCSGSKCDISENPENDQITRNRLIKLWTDFAKNPTPEPSQLLQNITWPSISTDHGDFPYLDINEKLEIKKFPKEETFAKWIELYNDLDYKDFDTY